MTRYCWWRWRPKSHFSLTINHITNFYGFRCPFVRRANSKRFDSYLIYRNITCRVSHKHWMGMVVRTRCSQLFWCCGLLIFQSRVVANKGRPRRRLQLWRMIQSSKWKIKFAFIINLAHNVGINGVVAEWENGRIHTNANVVFDFVFNSVCIVPHLAAFRFASFQF